MKPGVLVAFEAIKCLLLGAVVRVLTLILMRMPPTLGERRALADLKGSDRSARAKSLHQRTPIVHVEGSVEANIDDTSPVEVKLTEPIELEPGSVVLVEADTPLPVQIE